MVAVIDGQVAGGIGVAAAASACFESSYALQALEARLAPERLALRASLLAGLARRPRWLGGIALALAGFGLEVLALSLAPLTVVQPVLALGLLLLLYLGVTVLGEPVGGRELASSLAIVGGVTGIALSAPERTDATAGPLVLSLVLGALGLVVLAPYARRLRGPVPGAVLVAGAGAGDAWAAFAAKLVSNELGSGRLLAAAAWGAGAAAAALLGLTSETTALGRLPATRVGPPVLVMQVAVPVVLAPLLAGEDWGATPLGGAVIALSLAVAAAGTATLAGSRAVGELLGAPDPVEHDGGRRGQLGE